MKGGIKNRGGRGEKKSTEKDMRRERETVRKTAKQEKGTHSHADPEIQFLIHSHHLYPVQRTSPGAEARRAGCEREHCRRLTTHRSAAPSAFSHFRRRPLAPQQEEHPALLIAPYCLLPGAFSPDSKNRPRSPGLGWGLR